MEAAVVMLLEGLGEDADREGLRDTPERVVKAWREMTSGYKQNSTDVVGRALFNEPDISSQSSSGVICVRDIDFASTSSDNLLPFFGRCHIAYAPSGGAVLGLSKFARLVGVYSKRIQSQQKLTAELVHAISREVDPRGVAVVIEAQHLGFKTPLSPPMVTFECSGIFKEEEAARQEMRAAFLLNGVSFLDELAGITHSADSEWSFVREEKLTSQKEPIIQTALETLLDELYLDESRQESQAGVRNCVRELMHGTAGYHMSLASIQCGAVHSSLENTSTEDCCDEVDLKDLSLSSPRPDDSARQSEETGPSSPRVNCFLPSSSASVSSETESQHDQGNCCLQDARWKFTRRPWNSLPPPSHDCWIEGGCFTFQSMCEHHLLPFQGQVYIGYIPKCAHSIVSKQQLEEVVAMYSLRLQLQERMTNQIAQAIEDLVNPTGLVVMGRANHMCMVARGVKSHSSTTVNTVVRGEKTSLILDQAVSALSKCEVML